MDSIKQQAKEKLSVLIEEFNKHTRKDNLSEEETRTFITEFFNILGWNFKTNEVSQEEKISKGFVDYGFRLNEIPVLFVEAKRTSANLQEEKFVNQAIDYAWHKATTWAVLTNFKRIRVFNSYIRESIRASQLTDLEIDQYLNEFDQIWLLSKESFQTREIDKFAERFGKKAKEKPVEKQLFEDLNKWRQLLADEIKKKYSTKYTTEEIDEIIQLLLDRLILIRKIEDEKLESRKLEEIFHTWASQSKKMIWIYLKDLFQKFNEIYNSKIFSNHELDNIEISDWVLKQILQQLYESSDKTIRYDFSFIDADILGNIYEQYLGYLLKTKGKIPSKEKGKLKRKEHGIYYTPKYIVDYIVKNTLEEIIKNKKLNEIENIKILDPACGSGSFLIKAFDILNKYYIKKDKHYSQTQFDTSRTGITYSKKVSILENNIFGVDSDPKAVEIAQLNLLMKIAEKGHRLPLLQKNIRIGNSLIDDKKIDDKAFKWEEEFKQTMDEGGFDVVIGNPPYVDIKQLDPLIVRHFFNKYSTVENRMNIYSVFVEKALSLVKDGGYFGFIIPNSILYNESYQKIRKLLLNNVTLKKIVRLPDNVFQNVKVETIILIYQKKKETTQKENCEVLVYPREANINSINKENGVRLLHFNQKIWDTNSKVINITTNISFNRILNKMEFGASNLLDICDFSLGLTPYDKYKGHTKKQIEERVFHSTTKKTATFKPLLSGESIIRYGVFWDSKEYISYGPWLGAPREQRFFTKPRIIIRQIISGKPARIYAGYTEDELYNTQIAFNIIVKDEHTVSSKYVLAIVNSKLMNFYHKEKCLDPSKNLFQKILIANAKKFPIKIISLEKQQHLVNLVNKILSLNKNLDKIGDKKTNERARIEEEIQKIDKEIDQKVYELYGLTPEEIKIVESS